MLTSRCRSARTEFSVPAPGTWRPSRTGNVDVAGQNDGQETGPFRRLLSQDGRTAILPQDAAEIVRAWRESSVWIVVTDGGCPVSRVRARSAAACHWPLSRTEPRGR